MTVRSRDSALQSTQIIQRHIGPEHFRIEAWMNDISIWKSLPVSRQQLAPCEMIDVRILLHEIGIHIVELPYPNLIEWTPWGSI